MKVYIVTDGEYSDYHIEAVFTNKDQAEIYAAIHKCYLEEWDADEIKLQPRELYNRYTIRFSNELEVTTISVELVDSAEGKSIRPFNCGMSIVFTTKRDISNGQAIKIARDYIYQYRMEQIENEKAKLSKLFESVNDEISEVNVV